MDQGTLEIDGSGLLGNSARVGGAIFIDEDYLDGDGIKCNIKNSVFKLNLANYGACFALNSYSAFYVENTEFSDNEADYGSIGYLMGKTGPEVTLVNCTLIDNVAHVDGEIYEQYKGYNDVSMDG